MNGTTGPLTCPTPTGKTGCRIRWTQTQPSPPSREGAFLQLVYGAGWGAGNYSSSKIAASKIAGSKIAGSIIAGRDYSSSIIAGRDYSSPISKKKDK